MDFKSSGLFLKDIFLVGSIYLDGLYMVKRNIEMLNKYYYREYSIYFINDRKKLTKIYPSILSRFNEIDIIIGSGKVIG